MAYPKNNYPSWRWEFDKTRETIQAIVAQSTNLPALLEIGAGDGAFLRQIAPGILSKEQIVCVEYSPKGIAALKSNDITTLTQDVRELPEQTYTQFFSIICLFQVLEHLDGLEALFERFNVWTKPQAHLFISVPNHKRIFFNEQHGTLIDMPPNHVGRWTKNSFEALAKRFGWDVIDHQLEEESASAKAKMHLLYRFYRRKQDPTSWANQVDRLPDSLWRKTVQASLMGTYLFTQVPSLWKLIRDKELGGSQWIHLQKQ